MTGFIKVLIGICAFCSFSATACSASSTFVDEHNQAQILFLFVPVFLFLAIVFRFYHCRERLWAPFLVITSFMYIPGFIWLQSAWNSGDCGLGIIQAKWLMFTFALILFLLELFWFTKFKKAKQ